MQWDNKLAILGAQILCPAVFFIAADLIRMQVLRKVTYGDIERQAWLSVMSSSLRSSGGHLWGGFERSCQDGHQRVALQGGLQGGLQEGLQGGLQEGLQGWLQGGFKVDSKVDSKGDSPRGTLKSGTPLGALQGDSKVDYMVDTEDSIAIDFKLGLQRGVQDRL